MLAFPNFYRGKHENASYFLDDLEMALLASGRDENEVKLKAFPLVLKEEEDQFAKENHHQVFSPWIKGRAL